VIRRAGVTFPLCCKCLFFYLDRWTDYLRNLSIHLVIGHRARAEHLVKQWSLLATLTHHLLIMLSLFMLIGERVRVNSERRGDVRRGVCLAAGSHLSLHLLHHVSHVTQIQHVSLLIAGRECELTAEQGIELLRHGRRECEAHEAVKSPAVLPNVSLVVLVCARRGVTVASLFLHQHRPVCNLVSESGARSCVAGGGTVRFIISVLSTGIQISSNTGHNANVRSKKRGHQTYVRSYLPYINI